MRDKIEFNGSINEHGTLHIKNRKLFDEAIKRLGKCEVEIIVQKKRVVRSLAQNRWYWKYVVEPCWEAFRHLGHDFSKEETHDFLKLNFNYREEVDEATNKVYRFPQSTTRLTKGEFSEMIDRISQFAIEYLNIEIKSSEK